MSHTHLETVEPLDDRWPTFLVVPSGIYLGSEVLVPLSEGRLAGEQVEGHRIPALREAARDALASARTEARASSDLRPRAQLEVDAQVPYGTVRDVVHTLGYMGFHGWAFVVKGGPSVERGLIVPAIAPSPDPLREPPALRVYLSAEGHHVATGDADVAMGRPTVPLTDIGIMDRRGLGAHLDALREAHPDARWAALAAAPDVPTSDVLATLATLRGEACDAETGEGCRFTSTVLAGGLEDLRWADPSDADATADADAEAPASPRKRRRGKAVCSVENPTTTAGIELKYVERMLYAYRRDIGGCYRDLLADSSSRKGSIDIALSFDGTGTITKVKVSSAALVSSDAVACAEKAALKWRFPKPPNVVTISATGTYACTFE